MWNLVVWNVGKVVHKVFVKFGSLECYEGESYGGWFMLTSKALEAKISANGYEKRKKKNSAVDFI